MIAKFTISLKTVLFLMFFIAFSCTCATAQETENSDNSQPNNWDFLLDVYLMFPNMSGTTGVGTLPEVEVDANPGDIFDKLNMGAMLYFEATHDRWAFSSDLLYMSLKQDVKSGPIIQNGELKAKQLAWELAAMHNLLPRLEAGLGLRINSMDVGLDIVHATGGGGNVTVNRSAGETWADPILIARFKSDPSSKFIYQIRGDIGGFGIGSDFAWQIQAYAGYRFSKLFQLTGGYRAIGMDYNKGMGDERFMYNIDTFGPVVRFGFNF